MKGNTHPRNKFDLKTKYFSIRSLIIDYLYIIISINKNKFLKYSSYSQLKH